MYKKSIATIMVLMFALVSFSMAFATEGPDGNKRKGKYTYRKVYKACSATGEVESAVPTLSPADKKKAEWISDLAETYVISQASPLEKLSEVIVKLLIAALSPFKRLYKFPIASRLSGHPSRCCCYARCSRSGSRRSR